MRTVGRKIRPGEKHRWKCDRCGTLWDKRDLRRDGEGMWVCPQEGPGLDGATLSKGNAEHLRGYVQRLKPAVERVGRYGNPDVSAISAITAGLLTESGLLMVTEARNPLVVEREVALVGMGLESGDSLTTETEELLEI